MICNFILYVRDQDASTRFYRTVLSKEPSLHVPGMTEFRISNECILGLMPEKGIKRLLGATIEDPERTNGIARAEVYLTVDSPERFMERAIASGGRLLSPLEPRNWGDTAGYIADPDGHVIAFASRT
ncbi:MAG: VOC family protein [Pseudobdellovibrionaceae bacterium]